MVILMNILLSVKSSFKYAVRIFTGIFYKYVCIFKETYKTNIYANKTC